MVLTALISLHCAISIWKKKGNVGIPWLAWLFFVLGGYALAQSQQIFSWQNAGYAPPSVQIQKWALGLAPAPNAIQERLLFDIPATDSPSNELPCDLAHVPKDQQTLALSVEPLHTKAASISLILCGLMVWVGRMVFSDSKHQVWLFGALTLIGVVIACVGIHGAVSYKAQNFLGLRTGSSFATFVSKNSAGGYLNICIAGCLGLLGWTLLHTQRKNTDVRYRFPDSSLILKIRGAFEDLLADLNTPQIASMLCLVTVVSSLMISLCRGAAVSALAAIVAATIIANSRIKSRGSWVTTIAITIASVACILGFQLDDQAYTRLGSLSAINLDDEFKQGRAYIWSLAWQATQFYGWLGSGLGTFHFAYLPFQDPASPGWFYHAESLYAQCAVELGYLGIAAMVIALFLIIARIQKAIPEDNWKFAFPAKLAGGYLIISQSLHSFVDFALVLPALFIPASLLLGSVQGCLDSLLVLPPTKKNSEQSSAKSALLLVAKPFPFWRYGWIGLLASGFAAAMIFNGLSAVQSLAISDSMAAWAKKQDTLTLPDQMRDRVLEQAEIWSASDASLTDNPSAMLAFADAVLYDYRWERFKSSRNQKDPFGSAWKEEWQATSPAFLQVALGSAKSDETKQKILDAAHGENKANRIEQLQTAVHWYTAGHSKSPLDWRLAWGRSLANFTCSHDALAKAVPQIIQLGRHSSQQLLAVSTIFRDQLDPKVMRAVRLQAMKSNPGATLSVAKLLAEEQQDSQIEIDIFPQRADILKMIAVEVFTKGRFPKTNQLLWERSRLLATELPLSKAAIEVWAADASRELGDTPGEINHLTLAIEKGTGNVVVICRLANIHLDERNILQAKELLSQARRVDPNHPDTKALEGRILNLSLNR
jgi:O-Antigen ligase